MNLNETGKNPKYSRIAKGFAFVVVLYVLSAVVVYLRLSDMREQVTAQISKQQTLLVALSDTTAQNGADSVTESIIKDCDVEERTEFDELLSSLDKGLSRTDLLKLDNLFDNCGSFYAERKALMVSRLDREIEAYASLVDQLNTLATFNVDTDYQVEGWRELVTQEKKQSEYFTSLVTQQSNIIDALISGVRADSEEMKTVLKEARETQDVLLLTNRQTADLRATLTKL